MVTLNQEICVNLEVVDQKKHPQTTDHRIKLGSRQRQNKVKKEGNPNQINPEKNRK
jgi:hypothetical protein